MAEVVVDLGTKEAELKSVGGGAVLGVMRKVGG